MNRDTSGVAAPINAARKAGHLLAAAALAMLISSPAAAQVAQTPLYLGGGNVPGNLVLVPSVEFPTVNSVANLAEIYNPGDTYVGYFDSNKCYSYDYDSIDASEHFYPVGMATAHVCAGLWSGNFMNWAATQTIDPFRKVLTGGYRVKDTLSETWLEKARHDRDDSSGQYYPVRSLTSRVVVNGATPFDADSIRIEIDGHGNGMQLSMEEYGDGDDVEDVHFFRVRVEVCDPRWLEPNCRKYSGGWKPEGLIQEYADELRIGVFGYLNDDHQLRDGGVLRAPQKFVGPTRIVPGVGEVANPNQEWDPVTGIFIRNPDSAYATATSDQYGITILDSGAMNYLNKFGQLTANDHKDFDPVSELYYAALRYLKGQGNVPEYTNIPGTTGVDAAEAADGFPIITDWEDPLQYTCQKNVILGIGDAYTHKDKNLPGSSYNNVEPPQPAAVANDDTIDVVAATAKVAALEGITISNNPFSGRENSAFIAGMAWEAHTGDIRPGDAFPDDQTVSTHWVDVMETQKMEPPSSNQYYLATKYGGFDVPDDFEPETFTGSLPLEWWHTNDQVVSPIGERPDNYYLAGDASQMVESLTKAFARISNELRSSASSVAANSTRLDSNTAVFQAAFDSTNWSGELLAFRLSFDDPTSPGDPPAPDGTIADDYTWSAAEKLDALTNIASRRIFTITPPAARGDGSLVSTTGDVFEWADLAVSQQAALLNNGSGGVVTDEEGKDRLAYLRGSRLKEQPTGSFRQRDSRLGDIVNSDPQFVHQQDFGYELLDQSAAFENVTVGTVSAGNAYKTFRESANYQARPPMVVVGANDGMLHGFNASLDTTGGQELFAFVPNAAYEHLYELTLPEYSHRFFVDSSPRVADVLFGSAWHTIVVGAMGAGGRSVFALDVTNPAGMTSASVLWEFTHPSMGYTIGQPAVAPLPNGEFGVIVTSGYETGKDDGIIWILDPADGSVIHSFTVPNSGYLGAPLVTDLNGDRVADRIYVGDTKGNLWRFDLPGKNVSNWGPPNGLVSGGTPLPLFVAKDANGTPQAITAPLSSAFNDDGLHAIFFGTGSFYRVSDNVVLENPDVDSFYGIIDRGAPVTGRGELLQQSITGEHTVNGTRVRVHTSNEMSAGQSGWYLDFDYPNPQGERVVSRATVRGDRVIFATLIPSANPCDYGGNSWLMELNTFNGGRLDYPVYDLNGDGLFNEDDAVTVTNEDGSQQQIYPTGIDPDADIIKTPAIIGGVGPNNDEVKIMSGSGGELIKISERGSIGIGRQSWRQLR